MASRITNVEMWHPEWDAVQKEDRLLGISFTGIGDTITSLNWSLGDLENFFKFAQNTARTEADTYHQHLRIPKAKLALTIKPEGSISQLPTVSSGIHLGYAPLVQRSIRISSNDPLAKVLFQLGMEIVPENGSLDLETADTWILKFPVKYPTNIKSVDESAIDQLERYKCSMQHYTEHNTSITVSVAEDEWNSVTEWLLDDDNWQSFVGCAFMPRFDASEGDDGSIPNLPYVTITNESYDELEAKTPKLTEEELIVYISQFENQEEEFDVGSDCSSGGCSVR